MESLGKFPDSFLAEIAGQPAALRRAAEAMAGDQRDALDELTAAATASGVRASERPRRLVFTGMGASYFAGYAPVTSLASRGVGALHIDAAELLHFRMPVIGADTILVMVSQSGESAETVAVAQRLRDRPGRFGPVLVSVTNGRTNTLAGLADISFDTRAGAERGPSTLTFGTSLVVLAAMARAFPSDADAAGERDGPADVRPADVRPATDAAAEAAEALITEDPRGAADRFAAWFDGRSTLVTLGRGGGRAASEMGALILKEAAQVPAEALEAAQFRHGPLELAGPDLAAFVATTEPATEALDLGLSGDLAGFGAAVLVATTGGGDAGAGVQTVHLGGLDPSLAPAVAIIPMQLLAWRLSVDRGLDPTDLRVATKVTTHE